VVEQVVVPVIQELLEDLEVVEDLLLEMHFFQEVQVILLLLVLHKELLVVLVDIDQVYPKVVAVVVELL
tara:strand:- start:336 stop:542 length:207 start_codon:yes stop_codon:yes gene_type:complete